MTAHICSRSNVLARGKICRVALLANPMATATAPYRPAEPIDSAMLTLRSGTYLPVSCVQAWRVSGSLHAVRQRNKGLICLMSKRLAC